MTRTSTVMALALFSICVDVASPTETGSLPDPCALFDTEPEFVEFDLRLNMQNQVRRLRFPARFVDSSRGYGPERTTSLIRVDIDSFEPISRYQDHLRYKAGIYDKMTVLLSDRVSLSQHALINANLASGRRETDLSAYGEESAEFGLSRVLHPADYRETFLSRFDTNSEITDVFWCTSPDSVPFPGCNQIFKFEGINVSANYRRIYLPEWQNIRARIERFLICAIDAAR